MRIEISPKARQHLLAITDYYAEWGGVRSVERLLGKIVEKQQKILKYPQAFHPEPLLAGRKVEYRSVIINDYYWCTELTMMSLPYRHSGTCE